MLRSSIFFLLIEVEVMKAGMFSPLLFRSAYSGCCWWKILAVSVRKLWLQLCPVDVSVCPPRADKLVPDSLSTYRTCLQPWSLRLQLSWAKKGQSRWGHRWEQRGSPAMVTGRGRHCILPPTHSFSLVLSDVVGYCSRSCLFAVWDELLCSWLPGWPKFICQEP